jgi:hypothetical protein
MQISKKDNKRQRSASWDAFAGPGTKPERRRVWRKQAKRNGLL